MGRYFVHGIISRVLFTRYALKLAHEHLDVHRVLLLVSKTLDKTFSMVPPAPRVCLCHDIDVTFDSFCF